MNNVHALFMKMIINTLCGCKIESFHPAKLFDGGIPDLFERLKTFHQRLSPLRSDSGDIVKYRMHLLLPSEFPVKSNGKSVCLILYSCYEMKTFR